MHNIHQEYAKSQLRAALLNFYFVFDLEPTQDRAAYRLKAEMFLDRDGDFVTEYELQHHLSDHCHGGSL